MAQTIKLKRSGTEGNIPTTSQLELGEVAINTYDGKMFIKKNVGGTESIVEISAAAADAILVEYQFTSTASQTTYSGSDDNTETLSYTPNAIQVFMNGILLDPGIDFTATNGTSIVLSEAADANDYLQIFAFKKKIGDGNVSVDTFTGDDSTVAFTLSVDPGDENNTRVFIDGVYQSKSNYSVSGTTLTFSTAPPTGTAVEVEIGNRVVTLDTLSDLDLPDDVKLRLGTGQDLQIYHDGSNSYIDDTGTGDLYIRANNLRLQNADGSEGTVYTNNGGNVELYYAGSKKLETTNDGISVTGDVEADEFIGDLRGAILFKAQAGEALAKGDVVYISGISGNTTIVSKADADDASKMPAFGLAATASTSGTTVEILTSGILSEVDTSAYSEGDELFVSTTAGALTATAPTGESAALQKIGKVTRSNNLSGSIFITGAGRSNAVPNLNEGRLFVGNSSNQAVADDTVHVDIANSRVGIGTSSPDRPLNVVGTDTIVAEFENTTATGNARAYVTAGTASASLTQFGQSHATTPNVTQLASPLETRFINSGVTVATMKSSGNVGIGTTSPGHKLTISDTSGTVTRLQIDNTGNAAAGAGIYLRTLSSGTQVSNATIRTGNNGDFSIWTGTTGEGQRVTIDSSGNTGFGITTGIAGRTHVRGFGYFDKSDGTGEPNIRLRTATDSYGTEWGIGQKANSSNFGISHYNGTSWSEKVAIATGGNVGIGTDTPGSLLEVDDGGSAGEILLTRSGSPRVELSTNANEGELSLYRSNNAKQVYFSSYYNSYITGGNVGIGTTSPTTKLSVETPATDATNNLHRVDLGIVSADNGHASGYAASGMRILGQAKNSSGDDHTVFLEFNTRDPSLNGSHGTSGFMTLTTPDSQGTYGTGQFDFYLRNSAPYSFPNDPAVTSPYWMSSLMTIKSTGKIGISNTSPNYLLEVGSASSTESNIFSGRVNGDFIFNLSKANTNLYSIRNNGNSVVHVNTQNSARLALGVSTSTGTGTIEEHLSINSSGNVGIANANPQHKLHVGSAYDEVIVLDDARTSGTAGTTFISSIVWDAYYDSAARIAFEHNDFNVYNRKLKFQVSSTTPGTYNDGIVLQLNGNVGIGETSPDTPLEVKSSGTGENTGIRLTDINGTIRGNLYFGGAQNFVIHGASGPVGSDAPALQFATGGSTPAVRMTIQEEGGVRIATTSYLGNSSEKLTVVGTGDTACFQTTASSGGTALHLNRSAGVGNLLYFTYGAFGPVGSIYTDGSGTTYNTTSDQRLKENIVDAPSASEDIDAIQVRSFDWKTNGAHQKYGMVAQELLEVVPEAVSQGYSEQDIMGVDYSKLVPMLVKELQSLRARVAELENK